MGALKRVGGFLGFLLFLTPCIVAGIYTGNYSTSSLVQWAVGIGVAVVEISLLVFAASLVDKKSKNVLWAAVAIVAGVVPFGYWVGVPMWTLRPYQARVPMYLSLLVAPPPPEGAPAIPGDLLTPDGRPQIKGKIVPVDVKKKRIDPVFFDLSDDLRPKRPEEIGTLALLFCEENRVGQYGTSGGGAYQWECNVKVSDLKTGTALSERSFTGSMPPATSSNGASQTGNKPYKEIRDYLNGLPHR